MSDTHSILGGFATEAEFAKANDIHPRTLARYRNQPNGMPHIRWGGKIYIDVAGAREWLHKRVVRRNPGRRVALGGSS